MTAIMEIRALAARAGDTTAHRKLGMSLLSPLKRLHQEAEASLTSYGPAMVVRNEGQEEPQRVSVEVVETFGELEIEYAAIRKSCVVIDQPNRGVVEVTGPDRLEFLNRMLTQELKDLSVFSMRRSFWLNRKGRIDADVRVIDLPHATYLEMDVHAVARTVETLSGYVVMEDVKIADITGRVHRLALHGPTAPEMIRALSLSTSGAEASGPVAKDLAEGRVTAVRVENSECIVARDDSTGEIGLELIVPLEATLAIYQQMLEVGTYSRENGATGLESDAPDPPEAKRSLREMLASRIRLKPAGWHAYNIARIEAGTPLFNLDFGQESLPAETSVMRDRVSLTKGCYLGQEVVARMHARGQAKQRLVGIVFEAIRDEFGIPQQPTTGMAVIPGESLFRPDGTPIEASGVITSSTVSPMLGAVPVAFAAIKSGAGEPGGAVSCVVNGTLVRGTVQQGLAFWTR